MSKSEKCTVKARHVGKAAVTASLLLAGSVSIPANATTAPIETNGLFEAALAAALELLENEGVATAARNASDHPDVAQWNNMPRFQNY